MPFIALAFYSIINTIKQLQLLYKLGLCIFKKIVRFSSTGLVIGEVCYRKKSVMVEICGQISSRMSPYVNWLSDKSPKQSTVIK